MSRASTQFLKARLWSWFGAPEHPSEWDGRFYGGGKLSQRYWEYFKTIEMLDIDGEAVILDIGGGSPVTGAGFFARLVAEVAKRVVIIDPNIPAEAQRYRNIEYVRKIADYATLSSILKQDHDFTHVASVSVLEHMPEDVRAEVTRAIDDHFMGEVFAVTFEYHAVKVFFEQQLTAATMSKAFAFRRFYPETIEASPVLCEAAYDQGHLVRLNLRNPIVAKNFASGYIPQWYPLAVKFVRLPE